VNEVRIYLLVIIFTYQKLFTKGIQQEAVKLSENLFGKNIHKSDRIVIFSLFGQPKSINEKWFYTFPPSLLIHV